MCEIRTWKDHQNLSSETSDLTSDTATKADVFYDALEELPARRIRVIGPRNPTLISTREYELEEYTPANTPLKPNLQLNNSTKEEEISFSDLNINYKIAIGALNYISTNTRLHITFSVIHLSHFFGKTWKYVLDCMLTSTKVPISHKEIIAALLQGRRSKSGYTVMVNGHLVSWRTKKQPTISHSTMEAEYKALSDMTKEVEWLMHLLKEIYLNKENSTPQLLNDKKGAINLALSNANHNTFKTKHMDIKYHYLHDLIRNSVINL
ncbi:hypothetical protein O181_012842 [Austropuccinia psidii MF-1]|uniref:Reverse transcriptase Ty1/copia-type domain-containing protein n=1 Tax=Austropuccinia psidii MF-1 TaxID=1389203 RepID=A0A9Q3GND9_9BASI|nr:hypothetical protein [Austropuccinia psidii MF-1]